MNVFGLQIDGQQVTGQGRTKKLAKHAAAEAALRSVIQVPEMHMMSIVNPLSQFANLDFTSDSMDFEQTEKKESESFSPE